MKKIIILFSLFILAFCGREQKQTAAASQQEDKKNHERQELRLSPEKQKEWGIETAEVSGINISSLTALPGVLTLNLNATAHISSFVEGKVVSISADLGNEVRRGQLLLTINSPQFAKAQTDFLRARAEFNLSRKEYDRAKTLFQEKAIDQKEYLRREAEHEKLATETGALESILHSYGLGHEELKELIKKCSSLEEGRLCEIANPNLQILSPLRGTIIFRDVIVGEHVEPQKILFTASDLRVLWAILDAYEKDLPCINDKSRVTIKHALYPEKEFPGKITTISDIVDEKLRTVKIRVEVMNSERLLKPNMYIQGIVENSAGTGKKVAVPEEAVQNFDGKKVVFVLEGDYVFVARAVELGDKVGEKRIIAGGLKEGEKIAVKGAFNLKAELAKGTFAHEHAH